MRHGIMCHARTQTRLAYNQSDHSQYAQPENSGDSLMQKMSTGYQYDPGNPGNPGKPGILSIYPTHLMNLIKHLYLCKSLFIYIKMFLLCKMFFFMFIYF